MKRILILAINFFLLKLAIPTTAQESAEERAFGLMSSVLEEGKATNEDELVELWTEVLQREFGLEHQVIPYMFSIFGRQFYDKGNYKSANLLLKKAVELSTKALGAEHPDTLRILASLANTQEARGDLLGARQVNERILEARRRILGPEHPETLITMNNLGVTLKSQGDLAGAKQIFEEVLAVQYHTLGIEHLDTLTTLSNLAAILRAQGNLASAKQAFERALEALQRILGPEHRDVLLVMGSLAEVLHAQGDLVGAEQLERKVLATLRRVLGPAHPDTLAALGNLAATLKDQGDLAGARKHQEEVLEARRIILGPEHPGTLKAMANFATILKAQGNLVGARQYEEQVLETLRRVLGPEHPDTLIVMNNLATTLHDQGDFVDAKDLYEEVLDKYNSILGPDHPDTLVTMNNLAGALRDQGDLVGARKLYEKVLETSTHILGREHPIRLKAMHNLGLALKEAEAVEQARLLFEQVVEIQEENRNGAKPDRIEEATTLFLLAEIHRDAGRLERANDLFNSALEGLEGQVARFDPAEESTSQFRADRRVYYDSAIDVALRLRRAAAALHAMERYRAQSLLALLRWAWPQDDLEQRLLNFIASGGSHDTGIKTRMFRRDEAAQRSDQILYELNLLDPRTDRDQWLALREERSQLHREREAFRYQRIRGRGNARLTAFQLHEIWPHLDPGTLLLAFHVTKDGTNLFVLSRKGPLKVYRLPVTAPELWLQVAKFRALSDPSRTLSEFKVLEDTFEGKEAAVDLEIRINLGRWFYDQLLAKAGQRIAGSQRLLIMPDGPLYYLPFAALIAPALDKPDGWQYLMEWKPIHTAQSATVYAELQQWRKKPRAAPPKLAALGDPSYPPAPPKSKTDEIAKSHLFFGVRSMVDRGLFDGLLPLPNTTREIEGIAALFPEDRVHMYLGDAATEDVLAKQEVTTASYVHIAAHGLVDPKNSLDSFLALTIPEEWSPDKNNGILQAWEVIDHLRLDADLVVLSACKTAFGEALGGEGVMSLARAFQIAGARTVAASLWSVADESTAELMIRFYRHMITGGLPKDEALRAAQMEFIRGPIEVTLEDGTVVERDFSAPYHWAAFQLIGDWQ